MMNNDLGMKEAKRCDEKLRVFGFLCCKIIRSNILFFFV